MIAWEGQTQQTRLGSAAAGSYLAISFGTALNTEIYRRFAGVLKTAGTSFGLPAVTTATARRRQTLGREECVSTQRLGSPSGQMVPAGRTTRRRPYE